MERQPRKHEPDWLMIAIAAAVALKLIIHHFNLL